MAFRVNIIKNLNKRYVRRLFLIAIILTGFFVYFNKNEFVNEKTFDGIFNEANLNNTYSKKLPNLSNRKEFGVLLENLKAESMIEIGTQKGVFARDLLRKWPSFKQYYGIDPWKEQKYYKDSSNVKDEYQNKAYEFALKSLKEYGNKILLYRDFSNKTVDKFDDGSVDFIYLDGRHDYCGVSDDLRLYYPKLRCGGIMAGNAFLSVAEQFHLTNDDFSLCENGDVVLQNGGGVKGAVLDFTQQNNIDEVLKTNETWPSFYFMKKCGTGN